MIPASICGNLLYPVYMSTCRPLHWTNVYAACIIACSTMTFSGTEYLTLGHFNVDTHVVALVLVVSRLSIMSLLLLDGIRNFHKNIRSTLLYVCKCMYMLVLEFYKGHHHTSRL